MDTTIHGEIRLATYKNVFSVQQHDAFNGGFKTLTPIITIPDGEQFVVLGTERRFGVYPLLPLLASRANLDNPPDAPMPEIFEPLQDYIESIPDAPRLLLLRGLLGIARPDNSALWMKAHRNFEMRGYRLGHVRAVDPVVQEFGRMLREEPDHPIVAHLADTHDSPRRWTPEMTARLLRSKETATAKIKPVGAGTRRSWPFASMDVDKSVKFPIALAAKAQRAVHAYAAVSGKRFMTKSNKVMGVIEVRRIE